MTFLHRSDRFGIWGWASGSPCATTGSASSCNRCSRPPVSSWLQDASPGNCDNRGWLLSGFGVARICRHDEGGNEGTEQGSAPAASVMDELEEAEIDGQLLLRDATVRPEPGTQQRPEAFH